MSLSTAKGIVILACHCHPAKRDWLMEPSGGRHRPWLGIFESLIRNVFLLADRKFKAVVAGVSRDSLYEIRNLFDNRPWRVSARFSLAPDLTIRQVR